MKHISRRCLLIGLPWLLPLASEGQTENTIISIGDILPAVVRVAPGQITNLFVQGVGGKLTGSVAATSFPLPTVLAGISVALTQSAPFGGNGPESEPVPILAVTPISTCVHPPPAVTICGSYTEVTVQIPSDFRTGGGPANSGWLVVSENGVVGSAFEVSPFFDQVHVMVVTHADGSRVTLNSPAKSGEELVMWVSGLGQTMPPVLAGQPSPSPAPVTAAAFQLYFDYRPNSAAYRPYCPAPQGCGAVQPLFSGLTPGYAGLYQVNFVVPAPPAGTPPCNDNTPHNIPNPSSVFSNLTVSIFYVSLDGAEICVDPASAPINISGAASS